LTTNCNVFEVKNISFKTKTSKYCKGKKENLNSEQTYLNQFCATHLPLTYEKEHLLVDDVRPTAD
jgi:hypothetical protein